ncbi:MAG: hypothetical protein IMY74_00240 [Bacteroidetes bacterium]|nr:hypothetical protein [Bacteroidota bacterium]
MNNLIRIVLPLHLVLVISSNLFSQQPEFSAQVLFGPTGYILENTENVSFSQKFNYSLGGYLQFNIPVQESRISIRSGYFIDTKRYDQHYSNTLSWLTKRASTSFTYGNIPLLFGVQFNIKNKFYPFISLGLIFGHLISEDQIRELNDGTISHGFLSRSSNLENPNDLYVGFGMNFRLTKVVLIRVETFLSHQLNQGSGYNQDRFGRTSFGLKAGTQFYFF